MRKLNLLLAFLISSLCAWSQSVTIDKITYELYDRDGKTEARVVSVDNDITSVNIKTSVNIDGNDYAVTEIGEWSFNGIANAEDIDIVVPEGIITIGWGAFPLNFKSLSIPSSVLNIGEAFMGEIKTVVVAPNNPVYDSRDNCNAVIISAENKTWGMTQYSTLPTSVTTIGYRSFRSNVDSYTIPESITKLEGGWLTDHHIGTLYVHKGLKEFNGGEIDTYVIDEDHPYFYCEGNCVVERYKKKLIVVGRNNPQIPSDVVMFGEGSLENYPGGSIVNFNEEYPFKCKYHPRGSHTILKVPEGSIPRYMYSGWCRYDDPFFRAITDGKQTFYMSPIGMNWDDIYFTPFTANAGDEVTISLGVAGDDVVGFQFDLYLPEGISLCTDEYDDPEIYLSATRTTERNHKISCIQQSDGSWRVLCYSDNNSNFEGEGNEVCTIKVKIADNLAQNGYPISIKNGVVSRKDWTSDEKDVISFCNIMPEPEPYNRALGSGDVNSDEVVNVTDVIIVAGHILGQKPPVFDFWQADVDLNEKVNVGDITGIVNIILNGKAESQSAKARRAPAKQAEASTLEIAPFDIKAGETKDVKVLLNNRGEAFTGLQFDLVLPKGLSLVNDNISLGSRTSKYNHTITAATQTDGTSRVLAYSTQNKEFQGEEGDVIVLRVKADENLAEGSYDLTLQNIVLSRTDASVFEAANSVGSFKVEGAEVTGITETAAESSNVKSVYDVSGKQANQLQKGINIVEGKKVLVK